MTSVASIVGSYYAYKAHTHAKNADEAVNHKPEDEDRVFDMVVDTRNKAGEMVAWREDFTEKVDERCTEVCTTVTATSDAISRRITDMDEKNAIQHHEMSERVGRVETDLVDHIQWEQTQKAQWDGKEERRAVEQKKPARMSKTGTLRKEKS